MKVHFLQVAQNECTVNNIFVVIYNTMQNLSLNYRYIDRLNIE